MVGSGDSFLKIVLYILDRRRQATILTTYHRKTAHTINQLSNKGTALTPIPGLLLRLIKARF